MKLLKSIGRRIITDIRNGDIEGYLALAFSIVAFVIGLLDTDVALSIAIEVIAAVLALLAISIIRNRSVTQELNEAIEEVQHVLSKSGQLQHRGYLEDEIRLLIKNANSQVNILIPIGNSLRGLYSEIRNSLDKGCSIRIATCSSEVANLLALRSPSIPTSEDAVNNLQNIANYLEGISPDSDLIQHKSLAYVPSMAIYISDPTENTGKLIAFTIPFGASSFEAPSVVFDKSENPELFAHFHEQFEKYWSASD